MRFEAGDALLRGRRGQDRPRRTPHVAVVGPAGRGADGVPLPRKSHSLRLDRSQRQTILLFKCCREAGLCSCVWLPAGEQAAGERGIHSRVYNASTHLLTAHLPADKVYSSEQFRR